VNTRVGGTASHTLHATTSYHPPATTKPTNARCVMISRSRFGMFRGPFEMGAGDGLAVMRRSG
jgi:hypothetical protein